MPISAARYQGTSRGGRFWFNLGSARTVRVIFVAMIVYFLIIGGLVLAYSNVQNCLQDYSDQQAASNKARAEAAAIDRQINAEYDDLSTSERARLRVDQDAFLDLLRAINRQGADSSAARVALEKAEQVNKDSAAIGKVNDRARYALNQQRAQAEALRQLNPVPEAPSEEC